MSNGRSRLGLRAKCRNHEGHEAARRNPRGLRASSCLSRLRFLEPSFLDRLGNAPHLFGDASIQALRGFFMSALKRRVSMAQWDVFPSKPLEGNSLAVFFDGSGLSDPEMQALAREMNLSETTF